MRLIDADALEKDANEDLLSNPDTTDEVYWNDGAKSIIDLIKTAPTIDPVKHGKWFSTTTDIPNLLMSVCSECGFQYPSAIRPKFNYCPNCGAVMERSEESK